MRTLEEVLLDNIVSSLFLTGKDAVAHLLQMCLGCRIVVVMGRTAPEGFFVELYLLGIGTAIDHGAHL